jgi:type IV pilus assembly protein PilW
VHQSGTEYTKFNDPSGIVHNGATISYTASAKVTSLGSGPPLGSGLSIHRFSVNGNNFQRTDMMNNTTDTLFGNVMTFQAQYGFRTATNTIEWCDGPGNASCATFTDDATGWRRVHAVRIAMVIRNPQFENQQRDADGNCNASPASLTWWDDDGAGSNEPRGSLDLSALTDGRCYRHYVVETTVPLKNMIWNMEQ